MTQVANATDQDESLTDRSQFLTFTLGEEIYGIDILGIREIIDYGNVTTVPMMPRFIRGVINLRGSVVPVVDLSVRFGGEPAKQTKRTAIIIVDLAQEHGDIYIGMVVDRVNEVLEIPPDQIEPAPTFGAKIRSDFIKGMGKIDGRFLVLLDIHNVLSVDELSLLQEIHDEASDNGERETNASGASISSITEACPTE